MNFLKKDDGKCGRKKHVGLNVSKGKWGGEQEGGGGP
jgi:hypothetical protein